MSHPLLTKLRQTVRLSSDEEAAVRLALGHWKVIPTRQDIAREGDRPRNATVLLDGLMCRYVVMADGRRQILSFIVPGDFCDLSAVVEGWMDHAISTLGACTVAIIEHEGLDRLIHSSPSIREALWRDTLREAAIHRAWVSNLGRRSAYERLAYLFCEIAVRLESVGMKRTSGYDFTATQTDIGDALGLSAVHVNRMLQQLRYRKLITYGGNTFAIHDWERLAETAGFSAAYLRTEPCEDLQLSIVPADAGHMSCGGGHGDARKDNPPIQRERAPMPPRT
ncbi:MAG TPA: Crp/Fnr family transcriptional regulator [Xanthobacteraceae bacterium]|jgi:CRP-like cAMP-binding protein